MKMPMKKKHWMVLEVMVAAKSVAAAIIDLHIHHYCLLK